MPTWILPTLAAVLAAALVATSTVAVLQYRAAEDARDRRDQLAAEVAELRAEVEELQRDLEAAEEDGPAGLGGLLDGLLGEDADLDDLLGGLLGGEGEGLLDGLIGGGPDDDGSSAFDPSAAYGAACLTPDPGGGGLGGLGELFGRGDDGGQDLDALVATVAADVEELRELQWQEEVDVDLLDDDATRQRLEELSELDPDERADLEARGALLAALGSVPDDLDLVEVQRELLGDAVAGFYVPETGETVVRVPDDGLPGPVDRITLVHELQHALADQVLGLPDRSEPPLTEDTDASLGALALIEGDASLSMNLWALEHLSPMELLAVAADPAAAGSMEAFDDVPDVLVRELVFPYTVGLDHVCDLYLDGGWAAVDEAYAAPPTTSSEVLFGAPLDPVEVATVSAPGPGYEVTYDSSFGAAELLWQLEAPGGDPSAAVPGPRDRAAGWAGGTAQVWDDGQDRAAALSLAFDADATGCDTMREWAAAAFPDADPDADGEPTRFDAADRVVAVDCDAGDDVELVRVAVADRDEQVAAMLG